MGSNKIIDSRAIYEGGEYREIGANRFQLLQDLLWNMPGYDLKYEIGCVPEGFICDGCSYWPDQFLGKRYRKACFIHDYLCRHVIQTYADRYEADRTLRYLVGGAWGGIMFFGVRCYSISLEISGNIR